MIPIFRKISVDTFDDMSRLQDALGTTINKIVKKDVIDGAQLSNLSIGTAAVRISHTLGRQPLGWIVTDIDKNANIYRTAWDSKTITLTSSAAATTVSLWVY